jgi:hypothetical protein
MKYGTYATPRADLGEALREYVPENTRFIATEVLPEFPVTQKAATASVATREGFLKRVDSKKAKGAAFNRAVTEMEDIAYGCVRYGLEDVLDDEDRALYANDFDAELGVTEAIKHKLLVEQEIRASTLIFNTSTWTGATLYTDNSSSGPWDTTATDIVKQIIAAKEKVRTLTGMTPNALIVNETVLGYLLMNAGIKSRFPGAAIITEEMIRANLAAVLGLSKLIVGGKVYDSADQGQTASLSNVWSSLYAMVAVISTGSLRQGGLGRTFRWTKLDADGTNVVQYREEQTEGDVYRVSNCVDEKLFDASYGHLLKIDS